MEEWRAIPGYEGCYEVSDQGRVRSLTRQVKHSTAGCFKTLTGRILRTYLRSVKGVGGSYFCVCLYQNEKPSMCNVHLLVAASFLGERPEGGVLRHLSGDSTDNSLGNLKWGTPEENAADMVLHGRSQRGEKHPLSKLSVRNIHEIRALENREEIATYAEDHGVSTGLLYHIRARRNWKHIP